MARGDELTHAIATQPDDTELRLVYADWLEEHGEPDRATFIRTECALADVPKYDPRWIAHWNFAREHPAAGPRPPLPPGLEWNSFTFERGFAARLRVRSVEAFVAHAPQLFANRPVQELELDTRGVDLERFLACEQLSRVRRLLFSLGEFGPAQIARLVECPNLSRVSELSFQFGGITADGLRAFLHSPLATRVRRLGLSNNFFLQYGAPIHDAFHDAPPLPALERLVLRDNRMDGRVVRSIVDNPRMPNLVDLSLFDNPIGDEGLVALADSATLSRLQHLDVGKTHPRVAGARALLASPKMQALRSLGIEANRLGPTIARTIASTEWTALEHLNARHNNFGDNGIAALGASVGFPRLRALALHRNGGDSARELAVEASLVRLS